MQHYFSSHTNMNIVESHRAITFKYSRCGTVWQVPARPLPPVYFRRLSSPTTQPLPHSNIFYPLDASSASFNGLIPVADMYSFIFSWWWAVSCPKHVETYYKWNIYLLAASSWCSYLSLYDARKHKTEIPGVVPVTNIKVTLHSELLMGYVIPIPYLLNITYTITKSKINKCLIKVCIIAVSHLGRVVKFKATINLWAPCVFHIGQAFRYSPEKAFYVFNQQIYFIIWYLLDRASLI